jgi:hypothetical protein
MIIRGPLPDRNYTVLGNEVIRHAGLSWKARGLLVYLLSMPAGWTTRVEHLVAVGPDGRDAVRSGLAELEEAGFLRRWRTRTDAGRWEWHSVIYDVAQSVGISASCPQSTSENPTPENPTASKYR